MIEDKSFVLDIIRTLNRNDVDYIIAGGVAVVLQGVERLTMDIDTAISLETNNIEKFLQSMKSLNLVPRLPIPAESLLDEDKRLLMRKNKGALVFSFIDPEFPVRQVDFFLDSDLSYEALKNDIEEIKLDDSIIKIVTKEKLVELKLNVNPMRDKDMFDIKELQKIILDGKK